MLSGKILHNLQHFTYHLRIQRRCRFIKQHHFRFHAEGSHDSDSLLLSAGKLTGIRMRPIRQTYALQKSHSLFFRLFFRKIQQFLRADSHILQNIHMREQIKVLEHHAHLLTMMVNVHFLLGNIHIMKPYMSCIRNFQHIQASKKCTLSRTGRADDHDHFTFMNIQVDSFQNTFSVKAFADTLCTDRHIIVHSASASFPAWIPVW